MNPQLRQQTVLCFLDRRSKNTDILCFLIFNEDMMAIWHAGLPWQLRKHRQPTQIRPRAEQSPHPSEVQVASVHLALPNSPPPLLFLFKFIL